MAKASKDAKPERSAPLIKNMREARMHARSKIALAIIMMLGGTATTLAHEGKSIVDQYGDNANYEYFPDYPAAPWYRCHTGASRHPMPGEAGEHWSMPRPDPCERYRREPHR